MLQSAGRIEPNNSTIYEVAFIHDPDKSQLKLKDRVVMTVSPKDQNYFLRLCDNTLHDITTDGGYILVEEVTPQGNESRQCKMCGERRMASDWRYNRCPECGEMADGGYIMNPPKGHSVGWAHKIPMAGCYCEACSKARNREGGEDVR